MPTCVIGQLHQQFAKEASSDLHVAVLDKGSVKLVPKLNVDFSWYEPRLSLIPVTIHSIPSHDSVTYWWLETEGGRGVSHILTTVSKYLSSLPPDVRHVRIHCDNCGGENKSQYNVYRFNDCS